MKFDLLVLLVGLVGGTLAQIVAQHVGSIRSLSGGIVLATAGVTGGTWLGARLLRRVPEDLFRGLVSGIILAIGALLLFHDPE